MLDEATLPTPAPVPLAKFYVKCKTHTNLYATSDDAWRYAFYLFVSGDISAVTVGRL